MSEPWDRPEVLARWRLGVKIGAKTGGINATGQSSTGWAVIGLPPATVEARGVDQDVDPLAALLVHAERAMATGCEEIELYRYGTAEAFAGSRAAAEGMTMEQHDDLMRRAAKLLGDRGVPFWIRVIR